MKKSVLMVVGLVLSGILLSGCGGGGSSDGVAVSTEPAAEPTVATAALDPAVLDSAASFLAAATGKENPITSDEVIFINTVLEINALDRTPSCLYGDLWVLLRDKYGIPILDEAGCSQPIASEPVAILTLDAEGNPIPVLDENGAPVLDEAGNPVYEVTYSDYVPMFVEEYKDGEAKCSVVEGYEDYTQEIDLGRLNMVRASVNNPDTLNRAFAEAIKNINAADSITLDLAGRLVLHSTVEVINPDTGEPELVAKEATIDSPRENLALYRAMLKEGRLAGYGVSKIGEEGETIPAPWLEIRAGLELGDLIYLRDGTPGRDYGVDLIDNYADLSVADHDRKKDYHNKIVDFVQYNPPVVTALADIAEEPYCAYYDSFADAWERILDAEQAHENNLAGFTRHADDARRVITFMHEIIQGLPENNLEPCLLPVPGYDPPAENPPANDPRVLDFAAAMLGGAANKTVPVTVDSVVFINTVLDINDLGITDKGELFGDLWVLDRDENGVPSLNPVGCEQPIATELLSVPDQSLTPYPQIDENELPIPLFDINGDPTLDVNGDPVYVMIDSGFVPLFKEEYMDGASKCAIIPGYEEFAQEFAMGRLNCVRNAADDPHVLEKHLVEAMNELNSAEIIKRDLGGRLAYSVPYYDEFGEKHLIDKTIDSPLQNLAIYRALMMWGSLTGSVNVKQEGKYVDVPIEFADTVDLDTYGLGFLRTGGNPNAGIARLPNGYADFSGYCHCCQLDTEALGVEYVQWHDPEDPEFSCEYTDEIGFAWDRVLAADPYDGTAIGAFAKHADDARKVITFTHNIIQDMPE